MSYDAVCMYSFLCFFFVQEFRVMVENHKVQMEGWVKKECEQVDQEKRKLAIERASSTMCSK